MFKRVCAILFFITSLTATAQVEVPDTVRDQITNEVMSERGYYDAATIEERIRLWQMQQPQPKASGEITESGNCDGSCEQTGGDASLPMPRDVKFKGRMEDGEYTQNLIIKWKRPQALPEGSPYKLKNYKIIVSKDGMTYEKFKVKAKFKNNGKPKKHQKLKLRDLEPGNYTVQVRAKYKTVSSNTVAKTLSNKSSGGSSPWSSSKSGSSKKGSYTVADLQTTSPGLYGCVSPSHSDTTDLATITTVTCINAGLDNSDLGYLNYFTGLVQLNLDDNAAISNLSALSDLLLLEWLSVNNTSLNFNPLAGSPNQLDGFDSLISVYLNGLGLTTIPNLPTTVSNLHLDNNSIVDNAGGFYPANPLGTLSISNNRTTWSPDGPLSLTDQFLDNLVTNNVQITSFKAQGSLITDLSKFTGIAGLENLEIWHADLNAEQDFGNFSSFYSLSIRDDQLVAIDDKRPVYYLDLSENPRLKQVDLLRTNDPAHQYRPISITLTGSDALHCVGHFEITDSTEPLVTDPGAVQPFSLDNGQKATLPSYNTIGLIIPSLNHATHCKPNKVPSGSVKVYQDIDNVKRFVTWDKDINHDYVSWGVTHYSITSYLNGQIIRSQKHPVSADRFFIDNDLTPDKYSVQACTLYQCGYSRNSSTTFEPGLVPPTDLGQVWDTSDVANLKFNLTFKYPFSAFDTFGGKVDYFEIESTFPQADGTYFVARKDTNGVYKAAGWTSPDLIRNDIVGNTFNVRACNGILGCSHFASIVADIPNIPSDEIPVPQLSQVPAYDPNHSLITLNWSFPQPDDWQLVDYIKIIENQPLFEEGRSITDPLSTKSGTDIVHYTHDVEKGSFSLSRFAKGTYSYEIAACRRNREGLDTCSAPVTTNSFGQNSEVIIDRSEVVADDLKKVIGLNYHKRADGVYEVFWDYPSDGIKPDYFLVQAIEHQGSGYPGVLNKPFCQLTDESETEGGSEIEDEAKIHTIRVDGARIAGGSWGTLHYCKNLGVDEHQTYPVSSHPGRWYVQACINGVGCGDQEYIELNQLIISDPQTSQIGGVGGPDDLAPGHLYHSELSGTGWHFYWANGMRMSEASSQYAHVYDLVGYWFAYRKVNGVWTPTWYEARLVQAAGQDYFQGSIFYHERDNDNNTTQEINVGNIQLKFGDQSELGEPGHDQPICDQQPSSCATLIFDLNYSLGLFSQELESQNLGPYVVNDSGLLELVINDYSLNHLNPATFQVFNDDDHYSGLWQSGQHGSDDPLGTSEFSMLTWIEGGLENTAFAYFDAEGQPTWAIVSTCQQTLGPNDNSLETHLCDVPTAEYYFEYDYLDSYPDQTVATVPYGFNPITFKPLDFDPASELIGIGNFGRAFTNGSNPTTYTELDDFRKARYWIKITEELNYGSVGPNNTNYKRNIKLTTHGDGEDTMLSLTKRANLHGIEFNINEFNDTVHRCDLNVVPACNIFISWYTDDNFGVADESALVHTLKPYFSFNGGSYQELDNLCVGQLPNGRYSESKFHCQLKPGYDQGGTFTFQYRKQRHDQSGFFPIAQSAELEIIACSQPGGCDSNYDPPQEVSDPAINSSTTILTHQLGAGPVPGEGGVSGGTATYNLPLVIPPGRNGMTPDVSVNYSSKGGDGVMGIGWSVSVGSSIYRCAQTEAQDSSSHVVDFSDQDRLCLDGQRLYATSGSYWDNDTVYRTEMDTFARITKISDTEFKVDTKSGRTNTYEQTNANQQSIWRLTKETDSFGNTITYQYITLNFYEVILDRILYTGKGLDLGDRQVKFNYGDRLTTAEAQAGKDMRYDVSYAFGEKTVRTQLLKSIETYSGSGQKERRYVFDYQASKSNDDLMLSEVMENAYLNNSAVGTRTLLELNWSDGQWSNSQWLDSSDSNMSYANINTATNQTIIGDFKEMLGRAEISNDFNGDGIKEYLATSGNGQSRSLLFFDENHVLQAKLDLPTGSDPDNPSRVLGAVDLTLNGYTDLIDSSGVYSWDKSKVLPSGYTTGAIVLYFNYTPLPFTRENAAGYMPYEGQNIYADPTKTQMHFYDYDRDGRQDMLEYITPDYRHLAPSQTDFCYPQDAGNPSCQLQYGKLILHLNTTSCTSNACAVSFAEGKVIINDLEPEVDREREDYIWAYVWDQVTDVDDFNGDGYPDIHITRWEKTALTNQHDYRVHAESDYIYFTNSNTVNGITGGATVPSKELKDLGLESFTCQKYNASDVIIDEPCDVLGGDINHTKAFQFSDVNGDGLKDFVYHDRGSEYLKSWKVRLNRGGDPFATDANDPTAGHLFVEDYVSTVNDPANTYSLDQPGLTGQPNECAKDAQGNYASASLARKCNPFFRATNRLQDLDADGIPEMIMPEWDVTDSNGDSKPDNLVFNYCSQFNIQGSNYIRSSGNTAQSNLPAYELYSVNNLVPRYNGDAVGVAGSITALDHDPRLTASAFNPYTRENEPDYVLDSGFVDYINNDINGDDIIPGAGVTPSSPITVGFACSFNNGYIAGDVKDMYEDYGDMAALSDRGLYKFNAIKFELGLSGKLNLSLSKNTGIYRPLYEGSIGDLTGDGVTDTMSTVGCLFQTNTCTDIADVLLNDSILPVGSWNVDTNLLKDYGAPIAGFNQAEMPNMLTSVTKPSSGEWVSWDYHPISAKIDRIPNSATPLPLYTLPERGSATGDGYIDEVGAIGSHIFFNSSMYVVSEMRQSNGLKQGTEDQYSTTQYGYKEAVYNLQGRGFQGFREITVDYLPVVDSDQNKTRSISTFSQVFPMAGKLERVESYQMVGGELKLTQEIDYDWYDEANHSNATNSQVKFHPIESIITQSHDYDNQGTQVLKSEQQQLFDASHCTHTTEPYDGYGNNLCVKEILTETLAVKDKAGASLSDETLLTTTSQVTSNKYYDADTTANNWWVDKIEYTTVKSEISESGSFAKPYASAANLLGHSTNKFIWADTRQLDCQYTLAGSPNTLPSNCDGDINNTNTSRNAFSYDGWGNITEVKAAGISGDVGAVDQQERITRSDFTDYEGYFTKQSKQVLGEEVNEVEYSTTITYDQGIGQVKTSVDPAGVTTTHSYDAYGFKTESKVGIGSDLLEQPAKMAMQNCLTSCTAEQTLVDNLVDLLAPHIPVNNGFFFQSNVLKPQLAFVTDANQPGKPRITTWLDQNGQVVLSRTIHSGGEAYVLSLTNPLGQTELVTEPFVRSANDFADPDHGRSHPYFTFNNFDGRGRQDEKLVEVGQLNSLGDDCQRETLYTHYLGSTRVEAGFSGNHCATVEAESTDLLMYRSYDSQGKIRQTVDDKGFITQYWYDAMGNPHYITDAAGNHIVTHYDVLGRKTQVIDPNMGSKTFEYNSFGEVIKQQDAVQAGQVGSPANHSFYDQWGRVTTQMINVIESGGQLITNEDLRSYLDVFDYSTACGYGHNLLCGRERASNYDPFTKAQTDGFLAAHEITYLYDAFGRVSSEETVMPGAWGQYGTDNQLANPELNTEYFYYNNYNLLKQTIHNNVRGDGLSVVNHYAGYGELKKQVENPTGDELMRVDAWNLRGQPENRVLNNTPSMTSYYSYYPGTGQVQQIINGHNTGFQSFYYTYDAWGNIESQMLNGTTTESFKYDSLQRLIESSVGTNTISYGYDNNVGLGNLLSKSDYSTDQKYEQTGNAGPNAITSAALESGGTLSYAYDLNGNRIEDSLTGTANAGIQATYQYDAFNLLTNSVRPLDNQQISYRYGIDNLRYAKYEDTFDENGVARSEITLYLGPQFEQVVNTVTGAIESKFMLTDYLTLNMSTLNNKSRYFTQKDRLGSTTQILDENGNKLHTKGYDAFGKPRNGDNWLTLTKPTLKFKDPSQPANSIDITKRGFTDHEHLDAFELIHMNGRMYDFNNGRFLSIDPFIQGTTSQAINPYSYIQNNPLSGVDPTGYAFAAESFDCDKYDCGAILSGMAPTAAKNNGVVGIGIVIDEKGKVSEILTVHEDGKVKERKGSDYRFLAATETILWLLANRSDKLDLQAANDNGICTGVSDYQACRGWVNENYPSAAPIVDPIFEGLGALGDFIGQYEGQIMTLQSMGPYGKFAGASIVMFARGLSAAGRLVNVTNKLSKPLRNKLKRIRNQTAAGGNRGITGKVSEADALKLGEAFVGSDFKITKTGNGIIIYKSSDGLRQFRLPSAKKGINPNTMEPFSKTGYQVNFESRLSVTGRFTSNVHLDVDL